MKIDRTKIFLTLNKYVAYLINIVIIAVIAGFVGWFIWGLVQVIIS